MFFAKSGHSVLAPLPPASCDPGLGCSALLIGQVLGTKRVSGGALDMGSCSLPCNHLPSSLGPEWQQEQWGE